MRAPHATERPWLPSDAQVTVGAADGARRAPGPSPPDAPGRQVKPVAAAAVSPPIITRSTP